MTLQSIRAVLLDVEGAAAPTAFITGTLDPLVHARLQSYVSEHAEEEDMEDALDETGRLMGGFDLQPAEAASLLLRWMKQGRKATPLKLIQGRIWQEGFANGDLGPELYPDVADALAAWTSSGLRLFGHSSASTLGQKLLLGALADRFEGFFDTATGQKIEEIAYREIAGRLGLPGEAILAIGSNAEELEAAQSAGLATAFIGRDGGSGNGHPAYPDLASLRFG